MLIGADPSHIGDRCIRVTIHHCFFDGTRQRQPRVRFGKVHLYNNYTRNWSVYAVCASVESQVDDINTLKSINASVHYVVSQALKILSFILVFFIDIRYALNTTYMKQERRKWLLNIIQRRSVLKFLSFLPHC